MKPVTRIVETLKGVDGETPPEYRRAAHPYPVISCASFLCPDRRTTNSRVSSSWVIKWTFLPVGTQYHAFPHCPWPLSQEGIITRREEERRRSGVILSIAAALIRRRRCSVHCPPRPGRRITNRLCSPSSASFPDETLNDFHSFSSRPLGISKTPQFSPFGVSRSLRCLLSLFSTSSPCPINGTAPPRSFYKTPRGTNENAPCDVWSWHGVSIYAVGPKPFILENFSKEPAAL